MTRLQWFCDTSRVRIAACRESGGCMHRTDVPRLGIDLVPKTALKLGMSVASILN
jgi:hypothetical protein